MLEMKKDLKAFTYLGIIFSVIAFYIFNRITLIYDSISDEIAFINKINLCFSSFTFEISQNPFVIGKTKNAIIAGVIGFILVWILVAYVIFVSKNFMKGIEHGSSKWGTKRDILPLTDPEPDMNIPLSHTEKISVRKVKSFEADRNKNIVIVGGSGSGKTFSEIKPSLMQLHSSYVITDPKGTILPETGYLFVNNGFELRAFNTIDFSKSLHYNPLAYINKEKDILKVVNVLMENTNGEGAQSGDKFWKDCERLLYTAFIAYLYYEAPPEDQNIPMMIEMIEMCKVKEEDEDYQSPIDIMFEDLELEKPNCLAVKQYKKFKAAAGKTMKSILISCGARLAPFDIDELREIMMFDELQLDLLGDRKTAFFVIMSDTDSTYSFLIAMIMYQMFNLLCEKADNEYGGKLPVHVRCLFDEFANIGKVPDFQRLISTIRSREVSCTIILQSFTQLTSIYKDDAETIIDCCDTLVFLGGKSTKTTKQLSEMIGKTTIDSQNSSVSKGQSDGFSMQNQILGRDLIDAAEIGRLKRSQCLVLITGLPPFKSEKYKTNTHKRFKQIYDGGAPIFDIREAAATATATQEFDSESFFEDVSVVREINLDELVDDYVDKEKLFDDFDLDSLLEQTTTADTEKEDESNDDFNLDNDFENESNDNFDLNDDFEDESNDDFDLDDDFDYEDDSDEESGDDF